MIFTQKIIRFSDTFSLSETLSTMSDKLKYCIFLQQRTCGNIITSPL